MGNDNSKPKRTSSGGNENNRNEPIGQNVLRIQSPAQLNSNLHYATGKVNNLSRNIPPDSPVIRIGRDEIFSNRVYPQEPTLHDTSDRGQVSTSNLPENNFQQSKELPGEVAKSHELAKSVLDVSLLLELSSKESSHIVRHLINQKSQFENTIQESISHTILVILMKIVRKICFSNLYEEKIVLLKIVCCENFLHTLGNYLFNLPTHSNDCAKEDSLFLEETVIPFFETVITGIPDLICPKLRDLLIQTNLAISGLEQYQNLKVDATVKLRLKKLESTVKCHLNSGLLQANNEQEESHHGNLEQKSSTSASNHALQTHNKHLNYVTRNVFPVLMKKFDVPACKVLGMRKNIYFVDSEKNEEYIKQGEFLLALANYLLKQKYKAENILLLTTNELCKKRIVELKNHWVSLKDMTVRLINDLEDFNATIILISFAVNESEEVKLSIYDERQLCKAFLGAKNGIYMTGNLTALENQSSFWKEMRNLLQQHQAVSSELPILCEMHQIVTSILEPIDFKKLKNGGCSRRCELKLKCEHVCKRICHFDDREHKKYKCLEKCVRKPYQCSMNHICPKLCHEDCGLCTATIESNGNVVKCSELSSSERNKNAVFTQPLLVNPKKHDLNESSLLPCGHVVPVKGMPVHHLDLWSVELVSLCQKPCSAILECGHTCVGTCGSCRQGRVHMPCRDQRKITLACGHRVVSSCSSPVKQCNHKCFYECPHGMCKEKCGIPCTPCKELCTIGCEHSKCSKKCYELCDRRPCFAPCKKLLSCGHPCISLCGEPCPPGPEYCRVCNAEKLNKRDSSGNARFVLLNNCNHVVRCTDLDRKAFRKAHKVEALTCPICNYNITKTTRYLNYAKELHRNLITIRYVHKQYIENLTVGFWNIAKEIRSLSLPKEIENHAKLEEIQKQFQVVKDTKVADVKVMILLMFLRNLLYPIVDGHMGMASPHHLDWLLYLLLERYEMGLCSQVLRELYKEVIEYQKLKGTVYKKYVLELHKAIAFSLYLERDIWIKCSKGHLSTCNSLLTECGACDGFSDN